MSDPIPSPAGDSPITNKPAPAPAVSTAPVVAAAPKPVAKPAVGKKVAARRGFLGSLVAGSFAAGWAFFTITMTGWTLYTLRFLMPNVLAEPPSKVKVGLPDSFEEGKVVERFKEQNIWVVRNEGKIYALSTTCTHLGCTPNWQEAAQKFKCPCHGSGFYISGINFEGPAPRPLERWAISVGEDGQLVVDKSKKFQAERGDWSNVESFITV
jgi:cytochrome b6-f complex iron-sulfur subunit